MRAVKSIMVFLVLICFFPATVQASADRFPLKLGDRGNVVAEVQWSLQRHGYVIKHVDGIFKWDTLKAVKEFQKRKKIRATGQVDHKTYDLLMHFPVKKRFVSREAKQVTNTAMKYIGVPYHFGGVTPKGFDCSGFVQFVFEKNGMKLPRTADIQYKKGRKISRSELRQGDLVFFTTYAPGASHDGIYLGNDRFIHASSSKGVMISSLQEVYWQKHFLGAKRVIPYSKKWS
jgi:hypothetical protein